MEIQLNLFSATLTWTVILANYQISTSENGGVKTELPKFCFEFEFYNKQDPSYLLVQRFPVHYEDSEDVLDDTKCVKVCLNDVQRFLDGDKVCETRILIQVDLHLIFPHFPESVLSRENNFGKRKDRPMGSVAVKDGSPR